MTPPTSRSTAPFHPDHLVFLHVSKSLLRSCLTPASATEKKELSIPDKRPGIAGAPLGSILLRSPFCVKMNQSWGHVNTHCSQCWSLTFQKKLVFWICQMKWTEPESSYCWNKFISAFFFLLDNQISFSLRKGSRCYWAFCDFIWY